MITKELLKEAGWECVEVGDNGPATPKEYRNRYEVWAPVSESMRGCRRRHIMYDRTDDRWSYDGKTITEMDQLP